MEGNKLLELLENNISKESFGDGCLDEAVLKEIGINKYKHIESLYGERGYSEYCHTIYYFEEYDLYVKLKGYFNSYENYYYFEEYGESEKYEIVKPKQVTYTDYE